MLQWSFLKLKITKSLEIFVADGLHKWYFYVFHEVADQKLNKKNNK